MRSVSIETYLDWLDHPKKYWKAIAFNFLSVIFLVLVFYTSFYVLQVTNSTLRTGGQDASISIIVIVTSLLAFIFGLTLIYAFFKFKILALHERKHMKHFWLFYRTSMKWIVSAAVLFILISLLFGTALPLVKIALQFIIALLLILILHITHVYYAHTSKAASLRQVWTVVKRRKARIPATAAEIIMLTFAYLATSTIIDITLGKLLAQLYIIPVILLNVFVIAVYLTFTQLVFFKRCNP